MTHRCTVTHHIPVRVTAASVTRHKTHRTPGTDVTQALPLLVPQVVPRRPNTRDRRYGMIVQLGWGQWERRGETNRTAQVGRAFSMTEEGEGEGGRVQSNDGRIRTNVLRHSMIDGTKKSDLNYEKAWRAALRKNVIIWLHFRVEKICNILPVVFTVTQSK